MKRFLLPLVLFLALAVFLAIGLNRDPREVPSPLIGKPAPAFDLPLLADASKALGRQDLLGQVWMLNVWASWCEACRDEHPVLVQFAQSRMVPVYGLDYKDERKDALAWLRLAGDPYAATLFDHDGRTGIDFGVYGVPETFLIDQQGIIRLKHIGPLTPQVLSDEIEPMIRKLNG